MIKENILKALEEKSKDGKKFEFRDLALELDINKTTLSAKVHQRRLFTIYEIKILLKFLDKKFEEIF